MNIQDLIARNKIDDAIKLIPDTTTQVLIAGRFNRLKRQEMMGVIDNREARVEQSRIVSAILGSCDIDPMTVIVSTQTQRHTSAVDLEGLYRKHRRRNPEFGKEVMTLIEERQAHDTAKSTRAGYDVSGRMERKIQAKEQDLFERSQNLGLDSLESKTKKILNLIAKDIPSYQSLSEAWALCHGLGMSSRWIPQALQNQSQDDDVKINIAEAIEEFISTK